MACLCPRDRSASACVWSTLSDDSLCVIYELWKGCISSTHGRPHGKWRNSEFINIQRMMINVLVQIMLSFYMSQCGGDRCSNKMICMYSKAHCRTVESMTFVRIYWRPAQEWAVRNFTVWYSWVFENARLVRVLSFIFFSKAKAPCIVNEKMWKLKTHTQRKKSWEQKRMQFRPVSGYI